VLARLCPLVNLCRHRHPKFPERKLFWDKSLLLHISRCAKTAHLRFILDQDLQPGVTLVACHLHGTATYSQDNADVAPA